MAKLRSGGPVGAIDLIERRRLALVLLVGLLHGLIYVSIVPPWQHYEEPSHFEYAWMILTRRSLPGYGAYDNAIRRELAISMLDHAFFRDLDITPDLYAPASEPIWIGLGQADTAPLFHIAMTVPLALFANADVVTRLYAVRLTALGLYVVLLYVAYLLVGELVPPGHPLRWSVPAALALLPALTDIMTAFNDDVGAIFVFSLFLLAAVRLVRRGPSFWRLLAVAGLAALCAVTKTTVLIALPLALAAMLLSVAVVRRRWLVYAVAALALMAVAGLVSALDWGDALAWYRLTNQPDATRAEQVDAPWGRHALGLSSAPGRPPAQVRQLLLAADAQAIGGQPATVGAWIWASSAGPAYLPQLGGSPAVSVTVTTSPAFFAETVQVPTDTTRLAVSLAAISVPGAERTIYYDGLVLAQGDWPAGSPPVPGDPDGRGGVWAGQSFTNRLRNASAERAGPRIRPWAERLFERAAGAYLSPLALVGALADFERSRPIFGATTNLLLQSFWARFSWGQIGLMAPWYTLLAVWSGLGASAGAWRLWRAWRRQAGSWKLAVAWLGLAMLASWGTVYLRGLFNAADTALVLPVARYAYPVIIPTLLMLMGGWQAFFGAPARGAGARNWLAIVPFAYFLALDLASLAAIIANYRQV